MNRNETNYFRAATTPNSVGDNANNSRATSTMNHNETNNLRAAESPAICVICHDASGDNSSSVDALLCGHVFHLQCIRYWWRVGGNQCCTICKRASFVDFDSEDDSEILQPAGRLPEVIDMTNEPPPAPPVFRRNSATVPPTTTT
jgi:hypothetical protein